MSDATSALSPAQSGDAPALTLRDLRKSFGSTVAV